MNIRRPVAVGLVALWLTGCGDDEPGTIGLIDPAAAASERSEITVTAQRTGGSGGAVSVTFTTNDGTAIAGADYTATSGTLSWADGDTADKTVTVPVIVDLRIEIPETLSLDLGQPTGGATIGTASVVATIADDDHVGDSFAVTSARRLVTFDRSLVGRFTYAVDLSGFGSENVLGIDVRPADGTLYAITDAAKLYTLDPSTGVATLKSTLAADAADTTSPFSSLDGAEVGMDFDPVVDRLRVVSTTGQNLRIDVDTGTTTTDTAIHGLSMGYAAVAYNNNVAPACRTTLYAIDVATNRFLSQNPPNDGTANGIGGLGLDATASGGFDVITDAAGVSTGLALLTVDGATGFYAIDLASGAATLPAAAVLPSGEAVVSFAVPTLPAATPVTQRAGELYGVTATDVVSFNRAATAKLCTSHPLTGLAVGDTLVGIDMRPSTGVLYVLANNAGAGKLHRVDPATGNLSPAIPVSVPLVGTEFGMDFNPTGAVPLRIVSNTGQNIRVTDLTTGAATADGVLNGAGSTAIGAAYTDSLQGAGTTTLYVLDATADRLRIQNPPNTGALVDVGAFGVDLAEVAGFDIDGRDDVGLVMVTLGGSSVLHTIDLTTGAVSASLGTVAGAPLLGITRVTPQTNVFGLTTDNKLVRLSLTDPSIVTPVMDPLLVPPVDSITGLAAGEDLVGIDVRPGSNIIYGVGSLGAVYTVNASTASANHLGTLAADLLDTTNPFTALSGTSFGVDFDPTGAVAMRLVSDAEQSLRIPNVSVPKAFSDLPVAPPAGPIDVTAAAYSNSFVAPAGVTASTTLYVIDVVSGQLMIQAPPNDGVLTAVGPLAATGSFSDPAVPSPTGFDIGGGNNGIVLAAFQRPSATTGVLETFSRLYRINLATGAATEIGTGIGGTPLRGLAIQIR